MSTKVNIKYPIQDTVLFSENLKINYNLSNNSDPNVNKVVFILDGVEYTTDNLSGVYQITEIAPGKHELTSYLVDRFNRKITASEVNITFTTHEEKLTVENKINYVLGSTIPDFVKEDYPNFIIFLKAYYEWLYSSNNPFYAPLISEDYKDIDKTPEYFVNFFREQYLKNFPVSLTRDRESGTPINLRNLIKNISSFYSAKGTEKSIKFLLKILYDTHAEIYYPKVDLFKPSDSEWITKKSIKFIFSNKRSFKIKQKEIFQKNGETLIWRAFIDEIQVYKSNDKQIIEVFFSKENGTLDFNLPFFVDTFEEILELSPIKVISSITIQDGGLNYKINDVIKIVKVSTSKTDVSIAKVANIGSSGEIIKLEIINFMYTQDISGDYKFEIISDTGTDAQFIPNEGYVCNYAGFWINKNSHPDSIKVLPDNYRYQNLSYVIRTDRSLDRYIEPLKKLAHPAGMAVIGDILIQKMLVEPTIIQDIFNVLYTPLIGNYVAYRANTDVNVRSSPDLFPNGFDPNSTIPDQDGSDSVHIPITPLFENVYNSVFTFVPEVSDNNLTNAYWVVYPHPNTEINTLTTDNNRFLDIKLKDFLRQER